MQFSAETFENRLPEPVAFSCAKDTVISGSVTLHSQEISTRLFRMNDCQVDAITGTADLCVHFIPGFAQDPGYSFFKR